LEILKQGQYVPVPVEKQVLSVYISTNNYLENIPLKDIKRFEAEYLEYVETKYPEILEEIRKEKSLSDTLIEKIVKSVTEFLTKFKTSE